MSFLLPPSRVIAGVKQAAQILTKSYNAGAVDKSLSGAISTSKLIEELPDAAAAVKDKFVNTKAKANIEKMLGVENSVVNAEEKLRKELIDTQFLSAQRLFRRVHNSFIPAEFPSGEKINLKKSTINEITDNALKGRESSFEYTNKNGETIKGFVSKKTKKQGEDCFFVQMKRIFGDSSETIETRYYPKSSEIRSVGKKADGTKTISIISGNETGGKVKINTQSAAGTKLNIVSK